MFSPQHEERIVGDPTLSRNMAKLYFINGCVLEI